MMKSQYERQETAAQAVVTRKSLLLGASDRAGMLEACVRELGFQVRAVCAEDDLLAVCLEQRPDLILLDVDYGGARAGIAAGRRLRELLDLPLVYVARDGDAHLSRELLAAGAHGLVIEPARQATLLAALEAAQAHFDRTHFARGEDQHFRAILSSIGDAVITVDRQLRITFMNGQAENITEHGADESIAKDLFSVFDFPDEAAQANAQHILRAVLRSGIPSELPDPTLLVGKYGTKILIGDSVAPIVEPNGKVSGLVIVFRSVADKEEAKEAAQRRADLRLQAAVAESRRRDVEQRQSAEFRLRESNDHLQKRFAERSGELERSNQALADANRRLSDNEAQLRTLAEVVPNLLWTTDAAGAATFFSAHYERYTGVPGEQLFGSWPDFIHPDDKQRVVESWAAAVRQPGLFEIEYRLRRCDGDYRWFVARGVPVRDASGEVTQWMGSATEIHNLKWTEEALRRSNEELRQIAYAAAHDLQEPLRNVSTSVGMLRRIVGGSGDAETSKWMDASVESAQRMCEMVRDLQHYSRVVDDSDTAGEVDAAEIANLAIGSLSETIAVSEAHIRLAPLPKVCVNEGHLMQLFQHLLSNALKYRRPGVKPEIRVSAKRAVAEWEFSVADNGIGFDPRYAKRIFRLFKRLHVRPRYEGNGVGLPVCARIVAHYNGRIWADSQPGMGSTFRFTLPALRTIG